MAGFKVGIVKADGSGYTVVDHSIAALNALRAGQEPEDFGEGRKHHLPIYTGKTPLPLDPGESAGDPVAQSTWPKQDGGF